MDPKPLTKERRLEIQETAQRVVEGHSFALMCEEVLAAERFWREAVKNCDPTAEVPECIFCESTTLDPDHKPGCPWLLAQSE